MELMIYPKTFQDLRTLQAERKFVEEPCYPGAPDEDTRVRCESWINDLLEELILNVEQNPQKNFVKAEILKAWSNFEEEDTEEAEQAWEYFSRIMAILGFSISDEELNECLHGTANE